MPANVETLLGYLKSSNVHKRRLAVIELGKLITSDTRIVSALNSKESDNDGSVRSLAAESLLASAHQAVLKGRPDLMTRITAIQINGTSSAGQGLSSVTGNESRERKETLKKRCPYCAEEIQAAAIVCRYCGRDIGTSPVPALPISGSQKSYRKSSLWVKSVIIGVILAGLSSVPAFIQLTETSYLIQQGSIDSLAFRAALQNFLFHFFVNWLIWTIVAIVVIKIWRGVTSK